MIVSGEEAAGYDAIRKDTFAPANRDGPLLSADELTGQVEWTGVDGAKHSVELGPNAIVIQRRAPKRGR